MSSTSAPGTPPAVRPPVFPVQVRVGAESKSRKLEWLVAVFGGIVVLILLLFGGKLMFPGQFAKVTGFNSRSPAVGQAGLGVTHDLPSWIPVYPGSSPKNSYSSHDEKESQEAFTFTTPDRASRVVNYYGDELRATGYKVTTFRNGDLGGMISAEDPAKRQRVVITVGLVNGATKGSIEIDDAK